MSNLSDADPKDRRPENVVVVHDADYDGHGAGYAAYEHFGDGAAYVTHGDHSTPPEVERGTDLFLLDVGYSPEKMRWLLDRHRRVVVVDHHRTNAEGFARSDLSEDGLLEYLDGGGFVSRKGQITWYYDALRSAAPLAWEYFHGTGSEVPPLLEHIEDYDLWNFQMDGTDELTVALDQIGLSLGAIETYAESPEELIEHGRPMVEYRDGLLRRFADRADIKTGELPGLDEPVTYAVVNATVCRSKLAEHILDTEDEVGVVLMYRVESKDDVHGSLRSDGSANVSEIATELGGGGHARSAGFPSTIDEITDHFG